MITKQELIEKLKTLEIENEQTEKGYSSFGDGKRIAFKEVIEFAKQLPDSERGSKNNSGCYICNNKFTVVYKRIDDDGLLVNDVFDEPKLCPNCGSQIARGEVTK